MLFFFCTVSSFLSSCWACVGRNGRLSFFFFYFPGSVRHGQKRDGLHHAICCIPTLL